MTVPFCVPVVLDERGIDQHFAVEVAEHPLGPGLGTVDGDDAKVLRPNGLDARVNDAAWRVKNLWPTRSAPFALNCCSHVATSKK